MCVSFIENYEGCLVGMAFLQRVPAELNSRTVEWVAYDLAKPTQPS
jgi:hypothetical protein